MSIADLADVTHDPMLAALRQRLRRQHAAPRGGPFGLACVFSREPVAMPDSEAACDVEDTAAVVDGSLNCHGYGSSVAVTATFGMVAAARALESVVLPQQRPRPSAAL